MRVFLTGGSSFTGFWFARTLAEAGHEVVAPLSGAETGYSGIRGERVRLLQSAARLVFEAPFGSNAFFDALRGAGRFDRFCHHWAETRDYRSPDFDPYRAAAANLFRLPYVLRQPIL